MEDTGYKPLIGCERCGKPTRHHFLGLEKRIFQCVDARRSMPASERQRLDKEAEMLMLIHQCEVCNVVRGYGNIAPADVETE